MKELVLLILALGAGYWLYTDYQASGSLTGKAYYEACWEQKNKKQGFTDPAEHTLPSGAVETMRACC